MSRLHGPEPQVSRDAGYVDPPPRMGFFTDISICIGCKACEVACKEWNAVPDDGYELLGMSFDNTGMLGANSWRHVAFIEQSKPVGQQDAGFAQLPTGPAGSEPVGERVADIMSLLDSSALGTDTGSLPVEQVAGQVGPARFEGDDRKDFRWLMASDVCKHCPYAGCLDVCPTGALFRTEFGTVVVQEDVCNGCGYCVPACPYGVIDQRKDDGRVFKCTMCYDRLTDGLMPACATACPTQSIQFGDLDELQARADARLATLKSQGVETARLYGRDEDDGVGGNGAFFLLLDEPEVYGLPPDPIVTTRDLWAMWRRAATAAGVFAGLGVAAFLGRRP